jgi:hypothetical protein
MSQTDMDEPLTYEDIGHLLVAKGEKLEAGEGEPEQVIRNVLETLTRAERMASREKAVDLNGRVYIGRKYSGTHGLTVFHPDPGEPMGGEDSGGGDGER